MNFPDHQAVSFDRSSRVEARATANAYLAPISSPPWRHLLTTVGNSLVNAAVGPKRLIETTSASPFGRWHRSGRRWRSANIFGCLRTMTMLHRGMPKAHHSPVALRERSYPQGQLCGPRCDARIQGVLFLGEHRFRVTAFHAEFPRPTCFEWRTCSTNMATLSAEYRHQRLCLALFRSRYPCSFATSPEVVEKRLPAKCCARVSWHLINRFEPRYSLAAREDRPCYGADASSFSRGGLIVAGSVSANSR
jgi:hypothetical protein